jgi:predicted nucleic acid-binding protein
VYLLDTNVVSAVNRLGEHELLPAWMDRHTEKLFLSTVTIAEIESGIARLVRERKLVRSRNLTSWLESVLHLYGDRVLPLDTAVARVAGVFSDRVRAKGRPVGFPDIAIAATAKSYGLVLLTGNTKHFATFDIPTHNPFTVLPR